MSPWSSHVVRQPGRRDWHTVELRRDGHPVIVESVRGAIAANGRALDLLRDAEAGLVVGRPTGEVLSRAAARPLRAALPQQLDTASLPLFGDGHLQRELF